MEKRKITFSPPDITEREIAEVVDTLRSGWITTGPKTKKFEDEIAKYCGTKKSVALNSATAAMELALRLLYLYSFCQCSISLWCKDNFSRY